MFADTMSTRLDAVEQEIQRLSRNEVDMIKLLVSLEQDIAWRLPPMERNVRLLLEQSDISGASLLPETLNEESLAMINELEKKVRDRHQHYDQQAKRIMELEMEGDKLRSENSFLKFLVRWGESSPENTEVKEEIEALRTQLEKAKSRLESIEKLRTQSALPANDLENVDSCIAEEMVHLNAQIATLEEHEQRYKAVFADRISVLRRGCSSLFGYKVDMNDHQCANGRPVTRFTLQSIYAQSDDEKLEFEYEYESGNVNILENAYTSQPEISQQVDVFTQKLNSVPAFTANLTIESFNRRTLC